MAPPVVTKTPVSSGSTAALDPVELFSMDPEGKVCVDPRADAVPMGSSTPISMDFDISSEQATRGPGIWASPQQIGVSRMVADAERMMAAREEQVSAIEARKVRLLTQLEGQEPGSRTAEILEDMLRNLERAQVVAQADIDIYNKDVAAEVYRFELSKLEGELVSAAFDASTAREVMDSMLQAEILKSKIDLMEHEARQIEHSIKVSNLEDALEAERARGVLSLEELKGFEKSLAQARREAIEIESERGTARARIEKLNVDRHLLNGSHGHAPDAKAVQRIARELGEIHDKDFASKVAENITVESLPTKATDIRPEVVALQIRLLYPELELDRHPRAMNDLVEMVTRQAGSLSEKRMEKVVAEDRARYNGLVVRGGIPFSLLKATANVALFDSHPGVNDQRAQALRDKADQRVEELRHGQARETFYEQVIETLRRSSKMAKHAGK